MNHFNKLLKKHFYLGILLALMVMLFCATAKNAYVDYDTAYFSQASKQMLETHNYLAIQWQNTIRYQKPPGINWLQVITNKIFSHYPYLKIWPYRLPSILAGLLSLLLLYCFSNKYSDKKTALIAGSFLALSPLFLVEGTITTTDGCLLTCVLIQQIALANIFMKKKASWLALLSFWLAMSLGILMKGVTPLVALLTVLTLLVSNKDRSWVKELHLFYGFIFLVLSCFWLLLLKTNTDQNYLVMMLKKDLLPKLVPHPSKHRELPGFFLVTSLLCFFPTSLQFPNLCRYAWQERKNKFIRFLLCWILPTWLFFELMPSKLIHYTLPTYPAIALLAAFSVFYFNHEKTTPFFAKCYYIIWGSLFSAALIFAAIKLNHIMPLNLFIYLGLGLLLTSTILATYYQFKACYTKSILIILVGFFISLLILTNTLLPKAKKLNFPTFAQQVIHRFDTAHKTALPVYATNECHSPLVFLLATNKRSVTCTTLTALKTAIQTQEIARNAIVITIQPDLRELKAKDSHMTRLAAFNTKRLSKNKRPLIYLVSRQ